MTPDKRVSDDRWEACEECQTVAHAYREQNHRLRDALAEIDRQGPPTAANPETWAHRLATIARVALAGPMSTRQRSDG